MDRDTEINTLNKIYSDIEGLAVDCNPEHTLKLFSINAELDRVITSLEDRLVAYHEVPNFFNSSTRSL